MREPTQTTLQHPAWCDPRLCRPETNSIDHREAPMSWRVLDWTFSTAVARYDDVVTRTGAQHTARPTVQLTVEDMESVTPSGELLVIECQLSPAHARMLAAALVVSAERAEQVTR